MSQYGPPPQWPPLEEPTPPYGLFAEYRHSRQRQRRRWPWVLLSVVALGAAGGYVVAVRPSQAKEAAAPKQTKTKQTPKTSPRSTLPPTTTTTVPPLPLSSGVVQIVNNTSAAGGQVLGSGFLISTAGWVVTAAHVTDGTSTVEVVGDGWETTGTVVGCDDTSDVALIDLSQPEPGLALYLATEDPPLGTSVTVYGHAEGGPLATIPGTVIALDQTVPVANDEGVTTERSGMMEVSAAQTSGDSGGPVIDNSTGQVVGIVDAGLFNGEVGYELSAADVVPELRGWWTTPQPWTPSDCTGMGS